MAMTNNVFKPEVWSKQLTRLLNNYGVMIDCVNRDWEGEIKNQGDTVHIQQISDITVGTYDTAEKIKYEDLKGTSQELVIDQKKYWALKVDDIDELQANVKLADKFIRQAKIQIIDTKDAYLHALGVAGVYSNNQLGTVAINDSNIYSTFTKMFRLLSRTNAIDSDGKGADGKNPFLILPPEIVEIVKNSPKAIQATNLGDQTIRKGTILQFAGFDIKQSTVVEYNNGFDIIAGTSEGITFADQLTKTESLRDKDSFSDLVRGLYLYGAKVVQPKCLASAKFTVTDAPTPTEPTEPTEPTSPGE